jgi:ribose transport system substrate-binding protein
MKRSQLFTAILVVAAILAACAPATVATQAPPPEIPAPTAVPPTEAPKGPLEGKNLSFVLFSFDGYQQGQGSWFEKLAEAEGATVTLIDGKADAAIQLTAMEDAMATNPDGIVWHIVNGPAAVNAIKAAQEAGIPLVVTGSRPDPTTGATVPFVQLFDYEIAYEGGVAAAQWLQANKPGEKAKVVYFDRTGVVHCVNYRGDGFIAGITSVVGADNVEIVFRDGVTASMDTSMQRMEDLLQSNPDFNILSGCGSTHTLGALAALEAAGRGKAVDGVPQTEFIMSIDGTPDELRRLLDPTSALKAVLGLTPMENATKHLDTLKRVMSGELNPYDNITIPAPGHLMGADTTCEEVNEYMTVEYKDVKGYEPLDCSQY